MRSYKALLAGSVLALELASAAHAALPVYPTPGFENLTTYTFTAMANGDIVAAYAVPLVTAHFNENLGLLVNGVDTGINGLENHTTPVGTLLDFGPVHSGDVLTFYINVFDTGDRWFSNKAMNSDGVNHVFSTHYAGGDFGLGAGTYVAFEDLPHGGDFNYHDEAFVFTNVASRSSGTPEPASWALMILGFGAAGGMLRRRGAATA